MTDYAGPVHGLESTLGKPLAPQIAFNTFNFSFTQQNVFITPGQQGNGSVDHPISKQYTTCGHQHPSNAQFTVPQETYPNMHQPDTMLNPYQRSATHYEAHWPSDLTNISISYSNGTVAYNNAAAFVPVAREAAAMDGYAKAREAESARQSRAYAAE